MSVWSNYQLKKNFILLCFFKKKGADRHAVDECIFEWVNKKHILKLFVELEQR